MMPAPAKSDITSKAGSSGWHIALAAANKGNAGGAYLGDSVAVAALARAFIGGIVERYNAVCNAEMTAAEATVVAKAEALRYGGIFAGEDAGYVSMGEWNTGGGLAQWIRQVMPDKVNSDDDRQAITDAWAGLLLTVWQLFADRHAGELTDDGMVDALDGLTDDWTALMLGLPPESDEEPVAPAATRKTRP